MGRPVSSAITRKLLAAIEQNGACTLREAVDRSDVPYTSARITVAALVRAGKLEYSTRREPHCCRPVAVYRCTAHAMQATASCGAGPWWSGLTGAWRGL